MEIGDASAPVRIDVWHVHPWNKRFREGVVETCGGFVDLRDAQDVVNVGDNCEPCCWYEI